MAKTAGELLERCRFRVGEVGTKLGTFSDEEIYLRLNESQVTYTRDVYSGLFFPFRRLNSRVPCVSNQVIYTAPDDYLSMVHIYHHKTGQTPVKLIRKNIAHYREYDITDSEENTYGFLSTEVNVNEAGYYSYYEEVGQAGIIVDEGVITNVIPGAKAGTAQFTDENHHGLGPVRVGDVVTNQTDGSQAVITQIGSGIFSFDNGWHGGRSNYPQVGDTYIIQTREEHRFAFEVWPRISFPDLKITKGEPQENNIYSFSLNRDDLFSQIGIQFSIDDLRNVEQDTRLIVILTTENNLQLEIGSFSDARVGRNTITALDQQQTRGHQLYQNDPYKLEVKRISATGRKLAQSFKEIELFRPTEDYLSMTYVKRPAEFKIPESICELPEEILDGLVEKTVLTLLRKENPDEINQQVLANYQNERAEAREYLANRQPPEIDYVEDDELASNRTFTPGYSSHWF